LVSRSSGGGFVAKHTYREAPKEGRSYPITVSGSDAAGAKAILHLSALLAVTPPAPQIHRDAIAWPLWVIALSILISFAIGAWVEEHHLRAKARLEQGLV
jgi:hypothetical protein